MSDLLRKEDVIKAVWGDDINPNEDGMVFEAQSHIDRDIRLIPSADRLQGEWIEFDTKWGRSLYYCTNCMETSEVPTAFGKPLYDFCPNCGAKMKGADDE